MDAQAADLTKQIERLKVEHDQVVQEAAGKEALDKIRQDLNKQIGDASTQLAQIRRALASAEAEQSVIEIKAGQRDSLNSLIVEMSKKKDALSDEVTKLETRATSLRQTINGLLAPQSNPLLLAAPKPFVPVESVQ